MKRILTLLLAIAMLTAVCVFAISCGEDKPSDTTTASSKSTTSATTQGTSGSSQSSGGTETSATQGGSETTSTQGGGDDFDSWTGRTKMPGMLDVDFGGKTFLLCANNDTADDRWFNPKEIWVESLTNDAINDAVYERNQIMSELYNCTIAVDDGGWDNGFNADLSAGTGKYIATSAEYTNGSSGQYYNVLNLDIDWEQPWWNQNVIRDITCKDKLYVFAGDFALNDFRATWIMFYNKDVYDQNLASSYDIYKLVDDHKWTVDKLLEMAQKVLKDTDGDQEYKFSEGANADILGMITTAHNYMGLYYSCGERTISKDDNGNMICSITSTGKGSDVIDKVRTLTTNSAYLVEGYTNVQKAMENATTLFAGEVMDVLERMVSAESLRVGVVPQPLYDENQTEYTTYVQNRSSLYMIPTGYADMEEIADFFTLYAAHSSKIVRPAFINAYKYTYASDEDSARMIDLILQNRVYDPGYLYSFSSFVGLLESLMSPTGANNFASAANRYVKTTNDQIATYEQKILAINDPV